MVGLGNSQFRESAVVRNAQPEALDDRAELTTPGEWTVLAGLGLALAALVVWGVLGSVERTLRLDGALVAPGGAGRLEAVAFVAPKDAWRLEAGMTARVTVETAEGVRRLPAELAEISRRAAEPPDRLARVRPGVAAGGRGHTVRFALSAPPEPGTRPGTLGGEPEDGTPSRIEVVLERTSPFALLIRR